MKTMNMRYVKTGMLVVAGMGLLLGSGCARSIHGDAGEKGMHAGHGPYGVEMNVPLQYGQRKGGQEIPSLSEFQRSDALSLGKQSGEERIPNDLVVMSPSMSSGHRKGLYGEELSAEERQKGERLAAVAGLEDIFFGYDSSTLSDVARERLLHVTQWLQGDGKNKLMIEGHCDERGTIDYNLVLGEKRARAVQNFLRDQRLDDGRLMMVSYGKERPFCRTQSEPCYQQNRRGHLVVRTSK